MVWELDASDEHGLAQFDSIAGRYAATQEGLAFVVATRRPLAEAEALVRAAARRPTTAALVAGASSLLEASDGPAFLVSVEPGRLGSLKWRGRLVALEAALGRAFPLADSESSEEEEEGASS